MHLSLTALEHRLLKAGSLIHSSTRYPRSVHVFADVPLFQHPELGAFVEAAIELVGGPDLLKSPNSALWRLAVADAAILGVPARVAHLVEPV
jgi:hypothetical protein